MPRVRGRRPHEVVAGAPQEGVVPALVRNLADGLGGQAACCAPVVGELAVVAAWPAAARFDGTDVVRLPVADDGVLLVAGVRRWGEGELALLRETAAWLGTASALDRLRGDRDRARARAARLHAEVARARGRLAKVRDLERRRLVRAVTATTLRDLDGIRQRLRALPGGGDLDGVRDALDELLDGFRAVVRGVFPAMLPDRGPAAALAELAATLPRPVRFTGDLGRRVGWEVESGLYHAVAAVLTALSGVADGPVSVAFHRDNALLVRITGDTAASAEDLRDALAHDAERVAVLGGVLECAVDDGHAVVRVRVAEWIEPEGVVDPGELHRKVLDLLRHGRPAWDAVAERMTAPPRIAVVGAPDPGAVPDRVDGVDVIALPGPADHRLAEELAADDGVDAVLCLDPPTPAFRAALLSARQRVVLARSGGLADLAAALLARAPLIAARRALVAVTAHLAALPADHPLRATTDRITAEAHELAELDLLDAIDRDPAILRGAHAAATRLLGAYGPAPRTRLALPDDAPDERVAAAAAEAADHWRALAEHPATSGRDRLACEVLVRTAEGLLTRG
ncbi:hypothetical protein [Actinokineospora sp. NPDC004072]